MVAQGEHSVGAKEAPSMDRSSLLAWARQHADGEVADRPDFDLSLSSRLLRFRWNGVLTVAVGAGPTVGKTRINSVLDAVAAHLADPNGDSVVNLILGVSESEQSLNEHLGAIGTLVDAVAGSIEVRVWTISDHDGPVRIDTEQSGFTTATPARWAAMLMSASEAPVDGAAAALAGALVDRPSFALYPKLSAQGSTRPWQMRLDGLEIGRVGSTGAVLALATIDPDGPNEPRATWRNVVKMPSRSFSIDEIDQLVALIDQLIAAWTDPNRPGAVLLHGQDEHGLEAHILSGRCVLQGDSGPLQLAVPLRSGTLGAAQFPTLWGDVPRPARYLDALLADDMGRPWAVELKDQEAGGGHGAYLRHGVGQAVLYRHYIRCVEELDPWFRRFGLQRLECQAALAFPEASPAAAATVSRLRQLAELFDVEVIEFIRPS